MRFLLRMAFTIIAVTLMMLAYILYFTWTSSEKTLIQQAQEKWKSTAVHVIDKIDRFLMESRVDLDVMARDPVMMSRTSTPEQLAKRLTAYRDSFRKYVSISFFDLDQTRVADTSGALLGRKDSSFQGWDDLIHGGPSIGKEVALSRSMGIPVIYAVTLVKDETGQDRGIVVARIPLGVLEDILGHISLTDKSMDAGVRIDLVDKDRRILYSNMDREGVFRKTLPGVRLPEFEGLCDSSGIHDHVDGEKAISVFCREPGYADFKGNGWKMVIHIPTRIVYSPLVVLRNTWFWIVLPGVVIGIILSLVHALRCSRPLTQLKEAVAEVSRGGLDTKIDVGASDEVGDLIKVFNVMVQKLKAHEEENRRILVLRDEFTSTVSHELRTPLASIKVAVDLLASEELGKLSDQQKTFLQRIKANIDRLARLVNDILDLSKLETGKMKMNFIPLLPAALVADIAESHRPAIEQKGLQFRTVIDNDIPVLSADRDRLTQVLNNLLNNAMKFTSQGMVELGVSLARDQKAVLFFVRDTGPGIKVEDQAKLFGKFQQLGNISEHVEGTGLGLAISKEIVVRHGGRIWAESEQGQGSVFSFTIPLVRKMRVLVVDDDPVVSRLLVHSLEAEGKFEIEQAFDGFVAGQKVADFKPQLILLDIMMPKVSGPELCERIKADPKTRDIKVIIVASIEDDEKKEDDVRRAGADAIVKKPVNIKELMKKIDELA